MARFMPLRRRIVDVTLPPVRRILHPWLVVALLGVLASCRGDGPRDTLFAFVDALYGRDPEAPVRYLSRETRERLGSAATALRGLAGAADRKPHELMAITGLRLKREKRSIEILEQSDDRAVVRATLEGGGTDDIVMVREEGRWRIALGVVRAAPTSPLAPPAKK
jgi:hypothetical protein